MARRSSAAPTPPRCDVDGGASAAGAGRDLRGRRVRRDPRSVRQEDRRLRRVHLHRDGADPKDLRRGRQVRRGGAQACSRGGCVRPGPSAAGRRERERCVVHREAAGWACRWAKSAYGQGAAESAYRTSRSAGVRAVRPEDGPGPKDRKVRPAAGAQDGAERAEQLRPPRLRDGTRAAERAREQEQARAESAEPEQEAGGGAAESARCESGGAWAPEQPPCRPAQAPAGRTAPARRGRVPSLPSFPRPWAWAPARESVLG